jgi:hypothetical protein
MRDAGGESALLRSAIPSITVTLTPLRPCPTSGGRGCPKERGLLLLLLLRRRLAKHGGARAGRANGTGRVWGLRTTGTSGQGGQGGSKEGRGLAAHYAAGVTASW